MSADTRYEPGTHQLRADVVLAMSAAQARDRLEARLHPGRHESHDEAVPVRLLVGPTRDLRAVTTKSVRGEVLPPRRHDNSLVYPLRWEAIGLGAAAFPRLDADIAITAIDDITCLLSFLGRYSPPLGAFGALADRAAMSHVAAATAEAVVNRLARVIRQTDPQAAEVSRS